MLKINLAPTWVWEKNNLTSKELKHASSLPLTFFGPIFLCCEIIFDGLLLADSESSQSSEEDDDDDEENDEENSTAGKFLLTQFTWFTSPILLIFVYCKICFISRKICCENFSISCQQSPVFTLSLCICVQECKFIFCRNLCYWITKVEIFIEWNSCSTWYTF